MEYEERQFDAAFFSSGNEYMGFPSDETDKLWEDLYNCKWLDKLVLPVSEY